MTTFDLIQIASENGIHVEFFPLSGKAVALDYDGEFYIALNPCLNEPALKEALAKGKKSLRSVDKILLTWASREELEKDGITTRTEQDNMSLEETIRIAKTSWLDDDD